MTALKRCPCGEVPKGLVIDDGSTYRWRYVSGDCCGEWQIEAKVPPFTADPDDRDIYQACEDAWNEAPRGA
jgi:hypothetical protein